MGANRVRERDYIVYVNGNVRVLYRDVQVHISCQRIFCQYTINFYFRGKFTKMKTSSPIARVENFFIFNARYSLTAKEQKVILFLIAQIDPINQTRLHEQTISLKDLQDLLVESRSGSFYDEMQRFSERIVEKRIEFDSGVTYKGNRLPGRINWFQSIVPVKNEAGEISLEFMFSEKLTPFLVALKEYAQLDYRETLSMESGFSVRMYQVFRAWRDRMSAHEKISKLRYDLDEIKRLLGVGDKYDDWRNFKRRVLDVVMQEVNETSLWVKVTEIKQGRKVTALEFQFSDKADRKRQAPEYKLAFASPLGDKITKAQQLAVQKLVAYGVRDGIADEMVSKVQGSEAKGFEDWYFEEVIRLFETKTNQPDGAARAGTLVKWFLELKVFEQGEHFGAIMERLAVRKKQLKSENDIAWGNRLAARDMPATDFVKKAKRTLK